MKPPVPMLPGQIIMRNERGEWEGVWPQTHFSPQEKWFLSGIAMTTAFLLVTACVLVWL